MFSREGSARAHLRLKSSHERLTKASQVLRAAAAGARRATFRSDPRRNRRSWNDEGRSRRAIYPAATGRQQMQWLLWAQRPPTSRIASFSPPDEAGLSIAAPPMISGIFWLTADARSLTAWPGFIYRAALNKALPPGTLRRLAATGDVPRSPAERPPGPSTRSRVEPGTVARTSLPRPMSRTSARVIPAAPFDSCDRRACAAPHLASARRPRRGRMLATAPRTAPQAAGARFAPALAARKVFRA
jgi:hypothetical protein